MTSRSQQSGGGSAAAPAVVSVSYPFVPRVSEHLSVARIAADHSGLMRVRRLIFAGERCPSIAVEAFRTAITDTKEAQPLRAFATAAGQTAAAISATTPLGPCAALYSEAITRARELLLQPPTPQQPELAYFNSAGAAANIQSDPVFIPDQSCYQAAFRSFNDGQTTLEQQLLVQKRDGEREGIKVASLNLAQFYLNRGEVSHALNKYLEAKEFVTPQPGAQQSSELLHISMAIIKCSVLMINMSHVKTQVQRAQRILKEMQQAGSASGQAQASSSAASSAAAAAGGPSEKDEREFAVINCKLNAAHGLFHMKGNAYHSAASCFVQITSDFQGTYTDVLSASDIVTYGSICALASFSRRELKDQVLNNLEFKKLLESTAPTTWKLILQQFYNSNYAKVFELLENIKSDLYLDLFLSSHVNRLIKQIRERAFIQYFKAYVCVELSAMSVAFNLDIVHLEKTLADLIQEGKIAARIDSEKKILRASHSDQRNDTFGDAITLGNRYARDVRAMLLRLSLVENDMAVRGSAQENKQKARGGGGAAAANDDQPSGGPDMEKIRRMHMERRENF